MSAGTYDILVEQGAVFNRVLTWRDSTGALINLTGYTARLSVKQSYDSSTIVFEMTTNNGRITLGGAAGTVTLYISANDTDDIPAKRFVYDLKLVPSNNNNAVRVVQGTFEVVPQVTV